MRKRRGNEALANRWESASGNHLTSRSVAFSTARIVRTRRRSTSCLTPFSAAVVRMGERFFDNWSTSIERLRQTESVNVAGLRRHARNSIFLR